MDPILSHGNRIAADMIPGRQPAILFLPGFGSDMRGTKAEFLAGWCAARGICFVRFDYSGHGESGGAFADGTIGRWRDDALAVLDAMPAGKIHLVGSSMGGWIALLAAQARPQRLAGLVLLAPAPDFTEDLIWAALPEAARTRLEAEGQILLPSAYGPPTSLTLSLIKEGRRHRLLSAPIPITAPVRILHGQRDPDVPWARSLTLAERLAGNDVRLVLIKDGDHRLARPEDLALLGGLLAELQADKSQV